MGCRYAQKCFQKLPRTGAFTEHWAQLPNVLHDGWDPADFVGLVDRVGHQPGSKENEQHALQAEEDANLLLAGRGKQQPNEDRFHTFAKCHHPAASIAASLHGHG